MDPLRKIKNNINQRAVRSEAVFSVGHYLRRQGNIRRFVSEFRRLQAVFSLAGRNLVANVLPSERRIALAQSAFTDTDNTLCGGCQFLVTVEDAECRNIVAAVVFALI